MKSLLLIAVLLSAWPQGAVPTANGTIEGSVTLSGTSEPLPGVHVTADRGLEATTDSAGHFKFGDVPPGRYFVHVQDQRYARPSKGGYSKLVVAGPGEVVRNVDLSMLHTGILTGRLTYTDGKPVVGVEVEAIEPDYRPGQIMLGGAAGTWRMARTDNSGTYRIPTLEPGEYYVGVQALASRNRIYSPGTSDPMAAQLISIRPATETVANIEYAVTPGFNVTGKIVDTVNLPGPHRLTALYLRNRNIRIRDDAAADEFSSPSRLFSSANEVATNGREITVSAGQYTIRHVKPGSYDVFAIMNTGDGTAANSQKWYIGRELIEVQDRDVTDADVIVRPGVDVEVTGYEIRLMPMDNTPVPAENGALRFMTLWDRDGKNRVHNLSPGAYTFRLDKSLSDAPSAYLADVRQDGKSIMDSGLIVGTTTVSPIEVIVRKDGATIEGTVQSPDPSAAAYAKLSLVPNPPRRGTWELYKQVFANAQGQFQLPGIAPGDYKLFVFEDAPYGAPVNSDYIERFEPRGIPVRVGPGDSLTLSPPVIPKP